MYKVRGYSRGLIYGTWSVGLERKADGQMYWVDFTLKPEYKDIEADWNQYIFNLNNANDQHRKNVQDNPLEFDMASSDAVCFLELRGELTQTDDEWECLIPEESWY